MVDFLWKLILSWWMSTNLYIPTSYHLGHRPGKDKETIGKPGFLIFFHHKSKFNFASGKLICFFGQKFDPTAGPLQKNGVVTSCCLWGVSMEAHPFFSPSGIFFWPCFGWKKMWEKSDTQSQRWQFIFVVSLRAETLLGLFFCSTSCDRIFAETWHHRKTFPCVSMSQTRKNMEKLEVFKSTSIGRWQPNQWWSLGAPVLSPQKWQTHFEWTFSSILLSDTRSQVETIDEWSRGRLGGIKSTDAAK